MIPSPNDLLYFLEVANLSNLSRAAETLGISQPSLTMAMRRLEEAVGTTILLRHQRGVTLTRAGTQLLSHTRLLLQHWEMIKSETLASKDEIQGAFTIGCHTSLARYALPRFLPDLLAKHPRLDIKLEHERSRKMTEQVINLHLDLGIVVNPTRHPDLVITLLDTDTVTLWHNDQLTANSAVLLCDPDLSQTQVLMKAMKKQGHDYARLVPSNNLEVIADLTASGCGIGILPANVARSRQLMPLANAPQHHDEICLIYRGENRDVKALQVMTTTIKQSFKEMRHSPATRAAGHDALHNAAQENSHPIPA
jgi:DNA-binding transcriptional LysR family regulator